MLVAFNFDGSLAESDGYALLGEEAGVADEMTAISEQARAGELTLAESLEQRADRLEGLPEIEMKAAFDRVALRPGAGDLVADLQANDNYVAVISTAPERAVELAFDQAGVDIDTVAAPWLTIENNALTGDITGRLLDETKGEMLGSVATQTEIGLDETLAVGSDANDRSMLEAAADGVCFDPAAGIEQHCETTVTTVERLRDQFAERNLI
ncbi:MAG: phosphoserine phosphatase [Natronomonas sp.]|jgi:phosphoserine phosphatase|uniref:HAD-IB family phosphatase n=1 Tax=Natronomonas sp. TaxID=2184060 RepID=UPI003989EE16